MTDKTKNKKVNKETSEEATRSKGGLERKLRTMAIVPVILMGIVFVVLSYYCLMYSTEKEVRRNLRNMVGCVEMYYDKVFPGDFTIDKNADSDGKYHVYKGDVDVTETGSALAEYKEFSGMDFTLFYYDVRVVTTIKGDDGKEILYTVANNTVSNDVINKEQDMYYNNIDINGHKFFAVYIPVRNSDGSVVGMLFAGKPTREIEQESMKALVWIPIVTVIMVLIAGWISMVPARKIVEAIDKEKKFLGEIAKGNLNTAIDQSIVGRDDEIGDMGKFSRSVQKFIREMIERDTLTKLYTRRIGESKINYVQYQLVEAGVKYCVCMGDIDFFKKVNDTYGHDAGDLVLRDVAHIFNENMIGRGFTVRWGGEEFLIIFEDADMDKAYKILSGIREKILAHEMHYKDQVIKVTMTFGLTAGDNRHINDIVKEADNLLYIGKQNGRNQIVTSDISEKITGDEDIEILD